ncbi:uncharacterized protein LY89DRAFT_446376 [Mollisia scopiformis]|uniref:Uncharacterized protein n=1 Tax=Mollisia scopiformis TaxID=149040 RepID=A0A194XK83_MOLSC|nr:uncharacterized protein LY89DRAFT_446376 [Mollisia scopiformis]KUJ20551.1 hypothetical protein LY89DRAFT_446376 [Mollisia scopiformis]
MACLLGCLLFSPRSLLLRFGGSMTCMFAVVFLVPERRAWVRRHSVRTDEQREQKQQMDDSESESDPVGCESESTKPPILTTTVANSTRRGRSVVSEYFSLAAMMAEQSAPSVEH